MAWQDKPTGSLVYTGKDASGNIGKIEFTVPWDTLVAEVMAAAAIMEPLLTALTGLSIESYSISYGRFNDAPAAPVAKSRVEDKGVCVFRCSNGLDWRVSIPAILDSKVNDAGQIITTDLAVIAFVTAVTAVDAIFCNASGGDITQLKAAYQRFSGSTRNQLPSDKLL